MESEDKIYCPYKGKEIHKSESNSEHIIPLSLGGLDEFTLPVSKDMNQQLGSSIDGKMANDFLILFKRRNFGAKGHSKIDPAPVVQAKDSETGRPLQVKFGKQIEIWDMIKREKESASNRTFQARATMLWDISLQFTAKTALSAGYYVFGDLFKDCIRHQDLRFIMKGPKNLSKEEAVSIRTQVFHPYTGSKLEGENLIEFERQRMVCEAVKGSCVVLIPGRDCLGIFVGVLGLYMGMVNVPAKTDKFPRFDNFDMGHVILLTDGKMKRTSYRNLIAQIQQLYSSGPPHRPPQKTDL